MPAETRTALDTNLLAYAEGVNGEARRADVLRLLTRLRAEDLVVPTQALGELFAVLTRKAHWPADTARRAVLGWHDAYATAETSSAVLLDALELATTHRLGMWDAIIVAASAQAGCRHLLSEDMQDGFTWRGITIRNPFITTPQPL
jgi:predicted nucleic acid-binding protein